MLVRGILTTMSGSLGGITAARNRGGQYLRARVVPVDPGSPAQTTLRTIFGALSIAWQTILTAGQRLAWETYADNVTVVNRIGETVNLTGLQMYIRSNTPRVQAGLLRVDDGPVEFNLGEFTDVSIGIVGGTSDIDVTFDPDDAWANEDGNSMLVLASREAAPSINFFKGPYRLAGTIDGLTLAPPASPAAVTSDFSYTAGNKGFAQVRVSRVDGRLSQVQRVSAIAS
jgi:hypothetical protein